MKRHSRRHFFKTAGTIAGASFAGMRYAAARQEGEALPKITLTCSDYLRFTPLATGDLHPKDVNLTWVRGPRSDMLRRALSDPEVSGGETSMLGHLLRVGSAKNNFKRVYTFSLIRRRGNPLISKKPIF